MSYGFHRFSKDLSDVSWFHEDLFTEDESLRAVQLAAEERYGSGAKRLNCILCDSLLTGDSFFKRGGIVFLFCDNCDHVNGDRVVSRDFIDANYTRLEPDNQAGGVYEREFTSGKMADDYREVVNRIYRPKANFLADFLRSEGEDIEGLEVLDFGCGSGHFLNALLDSGFKQAYGFDSFGPAVQAGRLIGGLDSSQIVEVSPDDSLRILRSTEATVVSMMCVLVHLESPTTAIAAMAENPAIRYTYQKIPMWSFATILESAFPEFRARVLGSDHTNVFSTESIAWLERKFGLSRVASWTFGGDILDLERKILVALQRREASKSFVSRIQKDFKSIANPIQESIDKRLMASEIHLIWELPS